MIHKLYMFLYLFSFASISIATSGLRERALTTDAYGCITSAGYTWCAAFQSCIREWETPCGPMPGGDTDAYGCKSSAGYVWCDSSQSCVRPCETPCDRFAGRERTLDEDAHGCVFTEGYTWCEPLQSCIRLCETNCTAMLGDEEHSVFEEITEEIMTEVEAISESDTVPVETVYDVTSEVVAAYDDEDETTKEILGHIVDAVSELEDIHAGESGAVSDILTDIMNTAYGTEAPTASPTVKVEEPTLISKTKDMVTGATETATGVASNFISNVLNPAPTP